MQYYEVVTYNRKVNHRFRYDELDSTNLKSIIDAFFERINIWYLEPAIRLEKSNHVYAFACMALNCMLFDMLSQFRSNLSKSSKEGFKKYVREVIPEFGEKLQLDGQVVEIKHLWNGGGPDIIRDYADALYHAFRCGIVHEAHVTAYGMVRTSDDDKMVKVEKGFTKYFDGGVDCPTVLIDPWKLLSRLCEVVEEYRRKLMNPESDNEVRDNFKKKFTESFGFDIMHAELP